MEDLKLVPRCKVCHKMFKKSETNEQGLCPKCLEEKLHVQDEIGRENAKSDHQSSTCPSDHQVITESMPIPLEVIKVKPGQVIRKAFLKLVADDKVTDAVLTILTDKEATARELGIRYAFLKEFSADVPIKELTYVKNHARYSSKPIDVNGKQYLITNDLYSKNVSRFMRWADSIGQN